MSWTSNKLTDLLGIRRPVIQAPMSGSSTPELAIAVTNAGGLASRSSFSFRFVMSVPMPPMPVITPS